MESPVSTDPESDADVAMPASSAAQLALAETARLYERLDKRRLEVKRLGDYYRGKHPLMFASPSWRKYHAARYDGFSDNWCEVVGNAPSERIRVNGFRLGEDSDVFTDAERSLQRDWHRNELDAQSSAGFLESVISKRSGVLVWGDRDGNPLVTWEKPDQFVVDFDPQRPFVPRSALKAWREGDEEYANFYAADALWKWERDASVPRLWMVDPSGEGEYMQVALSTTGWKPRMDAGDDTWPLRNPMGVVPAVEIPNRPLLGGEAVSDIQGATAMQDGINLIWAYMFGAADHASLPARVVMGQEPPSLPILDAAGNVVGTKAVDISDLANKRMLWLNGTDTTISQWDPADLTAFTPVIELAVRHLGAQSRTPLHYFNNPTVGMNSDTLQVGAEGLVKKVEEFQLFAGPGVRGLYRLMALARGDVALAEECMSGRVVWHNAETRTTAQLSDAALKDRQIGFPIAWIAEHRFGMAPADVARLMAMIEAEQSDPALQQALSSISGAASQQAGTGSQGLPVGKPAAGSGA